MLRRRMMLKEKVDYSQQYFTLKALQAGKFSHSSSTVYYSVDGGNTWRTLSAGSRTPTVQADTEVMFRGTITPSSSAGVGTFTGTNNFVAEGNVMSLLYGDDFVGQVNLTGKNYAFLKLFSNSSHLQSAKNLILPATTLAAYCYSSMFAGCTSLTDAPVLPATTLAAGCYQSMFQNCTSLTDAPVLPATTLAAGSCYYAMFQGCTSLTTAPELPATTLVAYCYYFMFRDCTSLTTVPVVLPATTLTNYCYYAMFHNCTSLTTAPELPATTLVNYCYQNMFQGCSGLNYIKAMFLTYPSTSYTGYWVDGVASSGTFVKNSAATWNVIGVSGIPSGWTVRRQAAN